MKTFKLRKFRTHLDNMGNAWQWDGDSSRNNMELIECIFESCADFRVLVKPRKYKGDLVMLQALKKTKEEIIFTCNKGDWLVSIGTHIFKLDDRAYKEIEKELFAYSSVVSYKKYKESS